MMNTVKTILTREEGNKELKKIFMKKTKFQKINTYLSKISNNLGLCHLAMIK